MSISQVGQADLRLALPGQDQGGADFETAVKTSRLGLSLDGKVKAPGPDAKLDNLLEQLLTTLQPQAGDRQQGPGHTPPGGDDRKPGSVERGHGPVVHGGPGPVMPNQPGGQNDTAQLLQKVITLLNKQLDSGQLDPKQADQIAKLLPKLEQKFVAIADPQQGSGSQNETELLSELDQVLGGSDQQSGPGGPGGPVYSEKSSVTPQQRTYDPSAGISGDEIGAMIANANGQGPEVNFASYDRTSTNPT